MRTRKKNQLNDHEQSSNNTSYDKEYKGFVLGKGFMPAAIRHQSPQTKDNPSKKSQLKFFKPKDESTALVERIRNLGLMTSRGELYDPRTNSWVSANMCEDISIFMDIMNYFEKYPELKKGLPANAPAAPRARGMASALE